MFKALFYKEWIKTRRIVLLAGIAFAGVIAYCFINTGQVFRVEGPIQAWGNIILKDMNVLPPFTQWLPILVAVAVALTQYIPEMVNKRLKLTLHLPLPETRIVSIMLGYGIVVLLSAYIVAYLILIAGLWLYYPGEIIAATVWKSLPWLLAGLAGYALSAWICMEPVWRQRILNAFVSVCILSLFFIGASPGAYAPLMPALVLLVAISYGFPFYSAARFKEGKQ